MTMTPRLSPEQRQALERQPDRPVFVTDPATHSAYVLLSAAAYRRVRPLLEAEEGAFDPVEAEPLMDEVARREGWEDPQMDAYDALAPRHRP